MSASDSRDALRARIEEGQARLQQRDLVRAAGDAAKSAGDFVKAHPVASVAGVAVVALLIGAMTRPGRRFSSRAAGVAGYAKEAGIAYALGLLDTVGDAASDARRTGGDSLQDVGDRIDRTARKARREGRYLAATARDAVHSFGRTAGRKAGRAIRDGRSGFSR
ncbi:hypothetical protein WAB17_12490 [Parerythrobacter aurantius]|uniref:hypothetical protein n=1 Tax=Parerythrobacter aurantius TaxID=3127706 RepID=UPI00324DDF3B